MRFAWQNQKHQKRKLKNNPTKKATGCFLLTLEANIPRAIKHRFNRNKDKYPPKIKEESKLLAGNPKAPIA